VANASFHRLKRLRTSALVIGWDNTTTPAVLEADGADRDEATLEGSDITPALFVAAGGIITPDYCCVEEKNMEERNNHSGKPTKPIPAYTMPVNPLGLSSLLLGSRMIIVCGGG